MCGVKPVCYRNPLTRPPQSKGREGREGRKNHGLACAVRKAPGCSGHAALRSARHGGARFPAQLFCASARSVDDDHSKRCLSLFHFLRPSTPGHPGDAWSRRRLPLCAHRRPAHLAQSSPGSLDRHGVRPWRVRRRFDRGAAAQSSRGFIMRSSKHRIERAMIDSSRSASGFGALRTLGETSTITLWQLEHNHHL
jgi:hypothetical protein